MSTVINMAWMNNLTGISDSATEIMKLHGHLYVYCTIARQIKQHLYGAFPMDVELSTIDVSSHVSALLHGLCPHLIIILDFVSTWFAVTPSLMLLRRCRRSTAPPPLLFLRLPLFPAPGDSQLHLGSACILLHRCRTVESYQPCIRLDVPLRIGPLAQRAEVGLL